MDIKHLDTLVLTRSPEYDKLYNAMLKAYTLKINCTLVVGDVKIGRWIDMANSNNCIYSVEYKNKRRLYDGSNLYSIVLKKYNDRLVNIEGICNYMLNGDQYKRECEPWEVN